MSKQIAIATAAVAAAGALAFIPFGSGQSLAQHLAFQLTASGDAPANVWYAGPTSNNGLEPNGPLGNGMFPNLHTTGTLTEYYGTAPTTDDPTGTHFGSYHVSYDSTSFLGVTNTLYQVGGVNNDFDDFTKASYTSGAGEDAKTIDYYVAGKDATAPAGYTIETIHVGKDGNIVESGGTELHVLAQGHTVTSPVDWEEGAKYDGFQEYAFEDGKSQVLYYVAGDDAKAPEGYTTETIYVDKDGNIVSADTKDATELTVLAHSHEVPTPVNPAETALPTLEGAPTEGSIYDVWSSPFGLLTNVYSVTPALDAATGVESFEVHDTLSLLGMQFDIPSQLLPNLAETPTGADFLGMLDGADAGDANPLAFLGDIFSGDLPDGSDFLGL